MLLLTGHASWTWLRQQRGACTLYPPLPAAHVLHWVVMAATAALVMNVQVATRFLCTCPALYWHAAQLAKGRYRTAVWAFFLGYAVLGCTLHPSGYPWV